MTANFEIENQYDGMVCGLDEVGRGPLAGPVVAACVYIPDGVRGHDFIKGVKDSKKLSWKKLEALYASIVKNCAYGVAIVSPREIDELNILQASLVAMERAFMRMNMPMNHALIDGNKIPKQVPCPATAVVKGDSKSKSIAAASIVAKYTRDKIMHDLADEYPDYGWERNVGYPTALHREALLVHGVTEHHRRSFAPVRRIIESVQ